MTEKLLFWLGSSLDDLGTFPADTRRLTGFQLRRIQQGLDPNDWKPVSVVGQGVRKIRIHTELEHRDLYVAKFAEGVYVLHAFEKRTRKTSRHDLDLARERLSALLARKRAKTAR
jgi:phage-related protein